MKAILEMVFEQVDVLSQGAPSILLVVLLGCSASVVWLTRKRHGTDLSRKDGVRLPSPPKVLPTWLGFFGGHTLLLKMGKVDKQYEGWAEEFGGAYELFVFGQRRIAVVDPTEARRILARRPTTFSRAGGNGLLRAAVVAGLSPGLLIDEGDAWKRSRRIIAPAFSAHNVRMMVPAIVQIAERLCARWNAAAEVDGCVVDARNDFGLFTYDVIALVAFGLDDRALSSKEGELIPTFAALAAVLKRLIESTHNPLLGLSWSLGLPTRWNAALKKERNVIDVTVKGLIEDETRLTASEAGENRGESSGNPSDEKEVPEDRANSKSSSASSAPKGRKASEGMLLRKFLEAGISRKGGCYRGGKVVLPIPEEHVVSQARSIFVAGQETSSLALAWCIYFLIKNPNVLARCRAEVSQNISSSDGMVKDFEEVASLTYIEAVFKETLRIKSTLPFLAFKNSEEYTTLNGVMYPANTSFTLLIRYISTREENFTRAKEFIPERWIEAEREQALLGSESKRGDGDSETKAEKILRHNEEAFFPFGGGPRMCPGMGMTNLEVRIILATLCVRFDFALAPGQADPPEHHQALTSGPKDMKITLTRRLTK